MKTPFSMLVRMILGLSLALGTAAREAEAQDAPTLEIALYPGIQVTGEVGATYAIQSKAEVGEGFWETRGWIELTGPTAVWMDPVPAVSSRRIYRAVKATAPVVQTVANMVWIAAGTFTMGSPPTERGRFDNEGPQTRVTLTQGFWLGKHEVTQREYLAVMGGNPSYFKPPYYPEDLERPVEMVSWSHAVTYCQKLTAQERAAGVLPAGQAYRLPTEAEWEYACRAGTTTRFSFGDALECNDGCGPCALLDLHMWWCGNDSGQGTHRVGQKLPNAWGLFDMHANVSEWCQDWIGPYAGGAAIDPRGPAAGCCRVIRGGGWIFAAPWESSAGLCRSSYRCYRDPLVGGGCGIGFRIVLAPTLP